MLRLWNRKQISRKRWMITAGDIYRNISKEGRSWWIIISEICTLRFQRMVDSVVNYDQITLEFNNSDRPEGVNSAIYRSSPQA